MELPQIRIDNYVAENPAANNAEARLQAWRAMILEYLGDTVSEPLAMPANLLADLMLHAGADAWTGARLKAADLHIRLNGVDRAAITFAQLCGNGTKYLDALFFVACGRPAAAIADPFVAEEANNAGYCIGARVDLVCQILYIMIRGATCNDAGNIRGTNVPAFMVNTLANAKSPLQMCQNIASFELSKIGTEWIRYFRWPLVMTSIRSRLGLGLAGYRWMSITRYFNPMAAAPQIAKRAWYFVRQLAAARPDYYFLMATRSDACVAEFGSINLGVEDLIVWCLAPATIAMLVDSHLLPRAPVPRPQNRSWVSWPNKQNFRLADPIFPDPGQDAVVEIYGVNGDLHYFRGAVDHGVANMDVEDLGQHLMPHGGGIGAAGAQNGAPNNAPLPHVANQGPPLPPHGLLPGLQGGNLNAVARI